MRCFLAVPVEEPALSAVRRQLEALLQQVDGVRWVRPDALHLTVHFFGSLDDDRAAAGVRAVTPAAGATAPFAMTLDQLGAFPPRGRPHVLWMGTMQESSELTELAVRCRGALHDAGFEVEKREFRAHCTLGRPRQPWPGSAQHAWRTVAAHGLPPVSFTAMRLVLYESVHATGGNRYVERESLAFSGRAGRAAPC